MKVLLINPSSELNISSKKYNRFVSALPPLGIAYVASVLEKDGFDVSIEDQFASKITNMQLLGRIRELSPDVIGFSCLTTVLGNVRILVREIRAQNKNIRIVLGNLHPTLFAEEVLREGIADVVVRGEGEYSMRDALRAIAQKKGLSEVKGISFYESGQVFHSPDKELIEDLESLPYPSWHLFDLRHYTHFPIIGVYNELVLPVQSSRGCPYRCYFCSQDKIYPRTRYRSVKNVVDEIQELKEKLNVRYFGFNDAYFPFSTNHGMEFCDELVRRKLHKEIRWITETRVDKVSEKLLFRMKEAGLKLILYGFESGNQQILDRICKEATLEQARRAVAMTKKAGIMISGLFILGLPGETKKTCLDTVRFAKELSPEIAKFNIAVPFPGSMFFEDFKKKSGGSSDYKTFTSWYDYYSSRGELIYSPDGISSNELRKLQRRAMFEYYFRFSQIRTLIVKRIFSFKDLLYGAYILLSSLVCRTRQ